MALHCKAAACVSTAMGAGSPLTFAATSRSGRLPGRLLAVGFQIRRRQTVGRTRRDDGKRTTAP
eukprot:2132366-Alexandrium_andersonii.AAC.1